MGRKRKHPLSNGQIAKAPSTQSVSIREDIEARIGLNNTICADCNANNPPNADSCRKCGSNVRRKKADYADE